MMLVLFSNPRHSSMISTLNYQIFNQHKGFLQVAFEDATKNDPYGYLFINLKPGTPKEMKVMTNVLSSMPTVYVPKSI